MSDRQPMTRTRTGAVAASRVLSRIRRWFPVSPATPLVSIVIPVYNKQVHLEACLRSVLGQGGVNLEVLCVDDCSTDGSRGILDEVARTDSRVTVVENRLNCGAGLSRNRGIDLARGTFVQFTDADDLLPAGALRALQRAAAATGAEVVSGVLQGPCDPRWSGTVGGTAVGSLLTFPHLWIPWFHQRLLIARELLVGRGIRYARLFPGEDPVFMAEVLTAATRICVIPDVTYIYRRPDHRPRRDFGNLSDYVTHAEMVRRVYGDAYQECWQSYKGFITESIVEGIGRAALTTEETRRLQDRVDRL